MARAALGGLVNLGSWGGFHDCGSAGGGKEEGGEEGFGR